MATEQLDAGSLRIVVTDSGLGGLSVLAELEHQLNKSHIFKNVELIFFNALYSKDLGYNEMESNEEKAIVFNNALCSMQNNYTPNIILIACNTLSVIYSLTQFSNKSITKVEGIVEAGVKLFFDNLKNEDISSIILFGTPTTIESKLHRSLLVENGIDEHRIINQSCPTLESEIQDDPESGKVLELIYQFVNEVSKKVTLTDKKVFAGLCCTHYGYSLDLFERVLTEKFGKNIEILNPNSKMVTSLMEERSEQFDNTIINVEVISQVQIYEHEKLALSKILDVNSPLTVKAIENYNLNPNLFEK